MEKIKEIIREQEIKDLKAFIEECKKNSDGARAGDPSSIAWIKQLLRDSMENKTAVLPIVADVAFEHYLNATRDAPDYLDPKNPRYAPKLAAAVRAWQSVTDPRGKSAKQALKKWLRDHAAELGITDANGEPVNQAIDDAAKVANWQLGGGAPKTPSE